MPPFVDILSAATRPPSLPVTASNSIAADINLDALNNIMDPIESPVNQHAPRKQVRFGGVSPASTSSRGNDPTRFPTTWNLYRFRWPFHLAYTLGQHANAPLYKISVHKRWRGEDRMVLHDGICKSCPELATTTYDVHLRSREASIFLPGLLTLDSSSCGEGQVRRKIRWPLISYDFRTEIGSGSRGECLTGYFQWRRNTGNQVKDLEEVSFGFVLVRVASYRPVDLENPCNTRCLAQPTEGRSSPDIVAVLAGSRPRRFAPLRGRSSRLLQSKLLKFRFLGTGATGELGERWELMAVMSGLWIFNRMGFRGGRESIFKGSASHS